MTRNVVFVAPFPAEVSLRFARAVGALEGVRLLGLVHTPPEPSPYHDVERVEDPLRTESLLAGAEALARRHGPFHRIVGILEAQQVQIAQLRAHFGLPGTSPEVAHRFRDKAKMKAVLAQAGLPVARSALVRSEGEAADFARAVGYPLVLKPPSGMGAKSTVRVRDHADLRRAVAGFGVGPKSPMLAEEFLVGREFSFETLTLRGEVKLHSFSEYLPPCLEAVENPWIQWCCLLPKEIAGPDFEGARRMGERAIAALGLGDGMTHMEWFRRPDGRLAIGEIAQRPPGANISLMTGVAHGMDLYRAWARLVVDGAFDGPYERVRAVGSAFLRGVGQGRVAALRGVREASERAAGRVVEARLPTIGVRKREGYEGDGYLVVAGDDTQEIRGLLADIVRTIRVHYA